RRNLFRSRLQPIFEHRSVCHCIVETSNHFRGEMSLPIVHCAMHANEDGLIVHDLEELLGRFFIANGAASSRAAENDDPGAETRLLRPGQNLINGRSDNRSMEIHQWKTLQAQAQ